MLSTYDSNCILEFLMEETGDGELDLQIKTIINDYKLQEEMILTEDTIFKKSPALLKGEKIIAEMQKLAISTKGKGLEYNKKVKELEIILENQFGFADLTLDMGTGASYLTANTIFQSRGKLSSLSVIDILIQTLNSQISPNAYTVVGDPLMSLRNLSPFNSLVTEKTETGLRFKNIKPFGFMHINDRLMNNGNVTASEVMAVILHEIGHNFYLGGIYSRAWKIATSVISTIIKVLSIIIDKIFSLVNKVMDETQFSAFYNEVFSGFRKSFHNTKIIDGTNFTFFATIRAGFTFLRASPFLQHIYNQLTSKFDSILQGLLNIIGGPMTLMQYFGMDARAEEKFCDDFAAIHGYGSELAGALTKMSYDFTIGTNREDVNQKKIKEYSSGIMINHAADILIDALMVFDPHPANHARPVNMINALRNISKDVTDPKMKKAINQQIDEIAKNSIKTFLDHSKVKEDEVKNSSELGYLFKNGFIGSTISGIISGVWNSIDILGTSDINNFIKSADDSTKAKV